MTEQFSKNPKVASQSEDYQSEVRETLVDIKESVDGASLSGDSAGSDVSDSETAEPEQSKDLNSVEYPGPELTVNEVPQTHQDISMDDLEEEQSQILERTDPPLDYAEIRKTKKRQTKRRILCGIALAVAMMSAAGIYFVIESNKQEQERIRQEALYKRDPWLYCYNRYSEASREALSKVSARGPRISKKAVEWYKRLDQISKSSPVMSNRRVETFLIGAQLAEYQSQAPNDWYDNYTSLMSQALAGEEELVGPAHPTVANFKLFLALRRFFNPRSTMATKEQCVAEVRQAIAIYAQVPEDKRRGYHAQALLEHMLFSLSAKSEHLIKARQFEKMWVEAHFLVPEQLANVLSGNSDAYAYVDWDCTHRYISHIDAMKKLYGTDSFPHAIALQNYAAYLHGKGCQEEARCYLEQAYEIRRRKGSTSKLQPNL